jgi:lipoprotein-releasing system ATP-binding protein
MSEALTLQDIVRRFGDGEKALTVLDEACLGVSRGEIVALLGPSGSGKSTLLQIAGLLEPPTSGRLVIDGAEAGALGDAERTALRRHKIGFVYQFHHLLPEFTALENVVLPQMIAGATRAAARERGAMLLQAVGLSERLSHRPSQLSGGEQQRVAIARALANRPALLIADEPTGNLDPHTAEDVFALFLSLVRKQRMAALVATHNLDLARRMDRVLHLRDGRVCDGAGG